MSTRAVVQAELLAATTGRLSVTPPRVQESSSSLVGGRDVVVAGRDVSLVVRRAIDGAEAAVVVPADSVRQAVAIAAHLRRRGVAAVVLPENL